MNNLEKIIALAQEELEKESIPIQIPEEDEIPEEIIEPKVEAHEEITEVKIKEIDAHMDRASQELITLRKWAGDRPIYITEFGFDWRGGYDKLAGFIDEVYANLGIKGYLWATGEWWGDYPVQAFRVKNGELEETNLSKELRHLYGINLAGAEFGIEPDHGDVNSNCTYHKGSKIWQGIARKDLAVRYPFRLERLYTMQGQPKKTEMWKALEGAKSEVLLDPHNYGAYIDGYARVLGKDWNVESYYTMLRDIAKNAQLLPMITKISLMNEPKHITDMNAYVKIFQGAINVLRSEGFKGEILVPTPNWQGIQDVTRLLPNGFPFEGENLAADVHQYFDKNHSGAYNNTYENDEKALGGNPTITKVDSQEKPSEANNFFAEDCKGSGHGVEWGWSDKFQCGCKLTSNQK